MRKRLRDASSIVFGAPTKVGAYISVEADVSYLVVTHLSDLSIWKRMRIGLLVVAGHASWIPIADGAN